MPQDQSNLLMQLLLGGSQPDPTAEFIAQTFLRGQVPGDQGAAYQNVLTNLAPSVIAERRRLGPGMGEGLGMPEEEASQAISQMLGLTPTIQQGQEMELGTMKLEQERLISERESEQRREDLRVRQGQLEVAQQNAESLKASREAQKELDEARKRDLDDIVAIREMVTNRVDPEGNPLDDRQLRFLSNVAGARDDPMATNMLRLANDFLYSGVPGEREAGMRLLTRALPGFDFSGLEDPSWYTRVLGWVGKELGLSEGPKAGTAPGQEEGISPAEMEQLQEFYKGLSGAIQGLKQE